eukprot:TRINITY_DN1004_c0_g1_i1.p2 TRINITY_DN1004_c0_g1~~TRINITY_DN1004_c0_g1_i1.p2  ORF type:complete len:189 (+),score=23.93 TRINITY_DN1004_c0_g1_i1:203-769(+)
MPTSADDSLSSRISIQLSDIDAQMSPPSSGLIMINSVRQQRDSTDLSTVMGTLSHNPMNIVIPKSVPFDMADFECGICFRLYCKPVTTPCGHTYCRSCISSAIRHSHNSNCPACRAKIESIRGTFSVNIILASILQKYFKDEYEQREKEEEEDEELFKSEIVEKKSTEEDPFCSWTKMVWACGGTLDA